MSIELFKVKMFVGRLYRTEAISKDAMEKIIDFIDDLEDYDQVDWVNEVN
jgi:transcriptional/translational regulatory protein YebC/TACO1